MILETYGGFMNSNIYIYPTDTVWGIGGSAYNLSSYEQISIIKKTDNNKPLSLLFSSIDQLKSHVNLSDKFLQLFEEIYHLGLSVGVSKELLINSLPDSPFRNTKYVCFRVLESGFSLGLDEVIDFPITTTSLNITGQSPITSLEKAKDFWQKYVPDAKFIEAKMLKDLSGKASTIVLFSQNSYKVVREGENLQEITHTIEKYGYRKN